MSAFSFLACSFSTAMILLAAELSVLTFLFQFEKIRSALWQKIVAFRFLILVAVLIHVIIIIHIFCVAPSQNDNDTKDVTNAWARLWPKGEPSFDGEIPVGIIEFQEIRNDEVSVHVWIRGRITNIAPFNTFHGFHIHDFANYTAGCDSTGGHYNPLKTNHGDVANAETHRHVGDLGNVFADAHGLVNVAIKDPVIRLTGTSLYNIVGRPLVIHQDKDDLGLAESPASKINGNAGKRLACGTVTIRD